MDPIHRLIGALYKNMIPREFSYNLSHSGSELCSWLETKHTLFSKRYKIDEVRLATLLASYLVP
jgi:hypothetical protein